MATTAAETVVVVAAALQVSNICNMKERIANIYATITVDNDFNALHGLHGQTNLNKHQFFLN